MELQDKLPKNNLIELSPIAKVHITQLSPSNITEEAASKKREDESKEEKKKKKIPRWRT